MATPHDEAELGQAESGQRTGPSMLQVAWQRKSLVILGLMIGLMLGLLYYAQRPPVYSSSAQILVVKKGQDSLNIGPGQSGGYLVMDDYMATQSVLLKSPIVIGKAVATPKMKDLVSFRGENDGESVNAVRDALTVARDSRETSSGALTNVLTATIRGPIADECPVVLQALVDSYTAFLNDTYQNVSEKAAQFILNAREMLNNDLERDKKEYYDFCMKQPTSLLIGSGVSNMYTDRLARIETRRSALSVEYTELRTNYDLLERIYKNDGKSVALSALQGMGIKLPALEATASLDKALMEYSVKRKTLSATLGAAHPLIKELDDTIEMIKKLYGRASFGLGIDSTHVPKSTGNDVTESPVEVDVMQVILAAVRAEMDSMKLRLKSLEDQFEKEKNEALELATFQLKQAGLKDRLDSNKKLFEQIVQRAQEMKLVKEQASGGYEARLIHPPGL